MKQTMSGSEMLLRAVLMVGKSHFSKKVLTALSRKGVEIVGIQAIPAFDGDQYFSGTAYSLVWNGVSFLRTFQQVQSMALSSWTPEGYFTPNRILEGAF